MKKQVLLLGFAAACFAAQGQAILNSWIMNANGKKASYWANNGGMPPTYTYTQSTDSADVLRVCFTADSVWVRSQDLSDNLGKWLNPGSALAQNWVHRFPRNPMPAAVKTTSPMVAEIGMLVNGIAIYGLSNANSWSGTANANPQQGGKGIWNVEVGLSEGFVLDTAFGAHPQQQGIYHSHTTPYRLYKNVAVSKHSPLIGWAFDGYPIYGPYGYTNPADSSSGVSRMKSGYSLRNITTRTTMADGSTASQAGPAVSSTYPLGTYCEDYEWLQSNGGDLDAYNGRNCITPEFPQGTYAYFVTVDAAGKAQFPYYIGLQYYGVVDKSNIPAGPVGNGLSVPANTSGCIEPSHTTTGIEAAQAGSFSVYPNPAAGGSFTVSSDQSRFSNITVMNSLGAVVYRAAVNGRSAHTVELPGATGMHLIMLEEQQSSRVSVMRIVLH